MPSNKAPGFDKVSISVIKDCLPHILPSITSLINSSFTNSTFPKAWKRSEIVPLPKEGDFEQPCNNRPISLLPAPYKVSETIALNQFTTYLAKHSKLTPHQSSNKKLHSTETLGLLVSDHIYRAMDDKKVTAIVLIDLSKAFDSLSHPVFLTKLHNLGASENALAWFKSYLSERLQTTRVLTHGVPQGSILGPMLFNLYMNDLPSVTKECETESYSTSMILRSIYLSNR